MALLDCVNKGFRLYAVSKAALPPEASLRENTALDH